MTLTVTVNPQVASVLFDESVAVQVTPVEPRGNLVPEEGLQLTVTVGQLLVVGAA